MRNNSDTIGSVGMKKRVEILAPAGDDACLDAALGAGADAVYFGVDAGFNARARATNFELQSLNAVMNKIHDQGRRGYLTLNTLVFDHELSQVRKIIVAAAEARVDAVIVQDFGVARLAKSIVPTLRLHASTQMTCTDRPSIELAVQLGVDRVTLARELSLEEVRGLADLAPVELEIFAHGALCISYSGQCLTSEAIGGRSANRGACAQACRLPFDLVVDGVERELGDRAYLLSPKDLDASRIMPELLGSGISAIKLEGRLKRPEYVAATTRLYRLALAAALGEGPEPEVSDQELSTQCYSRGPSLGFLHGVDHQSLVDGTTCDHIGIEVGTCSGTSVIGNRTWLRLRTHHRLALGDGILVQGGRAGENELGGRIWKLRDANQDVVEVHNSQDLWVWLGPDRPVNGDFTGRRIFRTSLASLEGDLRRLNSDFLSKIPLQARLAGQLGERPLLSFEMPDKRRVDVLLDHPIERAVTTPIEYSIIREKLARLGDTPYQLADLTIAIPEGTTLPLSSLNRARREAVKQLATTLRCQHSVAYDFDPESLLNWPTCKPLEGGLFVTCRNVAQARAVLEAGASGVYLDFLAITGLGPAIRELRSQFSSPIGIALPRIRKPGEEKIDAYIAGLRPDALLLRSLGSLKTNIIQSGCPLPDFTAYKPVCIADFSINVTNTISALDVLSRAIGAFTPSFDLDAAQLRALLDSPLGAYAEVVLHHPMPLFHMEHCVIAALLSDGHDHRDCGRPCDHHVVSLRDRKGVHLPVEADIGCRNTVIHGVSQSAADQASALRGAGVKRFRIELVRETSNEARTLVAGYLDLLADRCPPHELRTRLKASGLPVVRGSLRVIG